MRVTIGSSAATSASTIWRALRSRGVGAAAGGAAQPLEQLAGGLAAAVAVAREEARQALLAEAVGVGGDG